MVICAVCISIAPQRMHSNKANDIWYELKILQLLMNFMTLFQGVSYI